jgi:hypothetical protein
MSGDWQNEQHYLDHRSYRGRSRHPFVLGAEIAQGLFLLIHAAAWNPASFFRKRVRYFPAPIPPGLALAVPPGNRCGAEWWF